MAGARTQSEPPDTRADTTAPDDALLAVRAAEGDEDAFAVLVQRHAAALIRLATSLLGTGAEAEDAVQDAFLSAWRRLPEFQGRSSFGTWMYRIVTNRCLSLLRARKPVAPLEAAGDVPAAEHATSPARITEGRDAVRELREALDLLSAEQRACWVLRELDGRSYEFVADAVGISQAAVRARVFRARRCLTQALGAWR
ncbi:RNA polymerase sigma factor [Streptomyces phaeochromogenes]|uniref:RNA polymerase sigma factor n=1 Tax=Streptomyces phaeochromogenes TaxID=1923 RepID=UPI002DDAD272|nr:RNA polymerase sigma factor [Streptomyces phaeochromogenes]WRZ35756.1 RNA polymerase sigma factor [Streptomyces phaeochromogenes]